MPGVRPLRGRILVHNFLKGERKIGKIIIPDDDGKQEGVRPRWAQIYKVGEGIDDLKEGQWILIEHGRWTREIHLKEEHVEPGGPSIIWGVDADCILAYTNEKPSDETLA